MGFNPIHYKLGGKFFIPMEYGRKEVHCRKKVKNITYEVYVEPLKGIGFLLFLITLNEKP